MKTIFNSFFEFSTLISELKKLERFKGTFFWKDYPQLSRYESVADHTWRLGVLLLLFENRLSKKIDLSKALKMVLIHDIPEVVAGDKSALGSDGTGNKSHAFNSLIAKQRHKSEKKAAKLIFGKLPSKQAKELYELWLDFDQKNSFEAKVVKSLDRIECMLQVFEYRDGHMYKKHLDFTIKHGLVGSKVDPSIHQFGQLIADKLKKKYKKFSKDSSLSQASA